MDKDIREKLRRELASIPLSEIITDLGHGPEPASNYALPDECREPVNLEPGDTATKYLNFFRDDLDPGKQIRDLADVLSNGTGILFEDEMEFFNTLLVEKMFHTGDITGMIIEDVEDGQKEDN